jgi:hypothetical protein
MREINFNVNQQRISNKDSVCHIYKGTDNYLCLVFSFNDDWADCVKGISFVRKNKEELAMILKDDRCTVPAEAFDETQLVFYLVGKKKTPKYRIETQKFTIKLGG